MYFTIPTTPVSTPPLPLDAHESFQRLRWNAEALAGVSASFATEASAVARAYARALQTGDNEAWASFVAAAASIAEHGESVDALLHFEPRRRDAYDFFAQIARENDDLLPSGAFSVA